MKYDDASWHSGGDFPSDLPREAGATHIGMFLAWCLLNGLGADECRGVAQTLQRRAMTPGQCFIADCDGKFCDEELTDEGNAFASAYYSGEGPGSFLADYGVALDPEGELASDYHVPDSWETYARLAPAIAHAYSVWQSRSPDMISPAERYQQVCGEVGEALVPLGYRYAKSGPHVSRRRTSLGFRVGFSERAGFRDFLLSLGISSRKLKAWRAAHGVPNPHEWVVLGGTHVLLGDDSGHGWPVADRDVVARLAAYVRASVEPLFSGFERPERCVGDAVDLWLPGWSLMRRLEFVLCYGTPEQGRQAAVNWLQRNPAFLGQFRSHYNSYRGEGLVPYAGSGYPKELAHASHVFGFGDLSEDVIPE